MSTKSDGGTGVGAACEGNQHSSKLSIYITNTKIDCALS